MENELQSKVKSLNEHQSKVDKMEEELMEIAKKQKQIFRAEVCMYVRKILRSVKRFFTLMISSWEVKE